MKFSLIIATINRVSEVRDFFECMTFSTYNNFEIYLLDQNENGILDELVAQYSSRLDIIHVKSSVKGLSYNRNIGIEMATGDIIAFPDDDCTYYENTLEQVVRIFLCDETLSFISGRIFDRVKKTNIIKNWPRFDKEINFNNFYFLSSSITLFYKKTDGVNVFFDENLGVGASYGSCEDPDFLISLLNRGFIGRYITSVEVNHPIPDDSNTPLSKRVSYASGFGYMIGKYNKIIFLSLGVGFILKNMMRVISRKLSVDAFCKIMISMCIGYRGGKDR